MDTISCLLRYPWRTLVALAPVYDLHAHHRRPKEQVAQELGAAIHAQLPQTLAALGPDARAALRALAQADGLAIPRAHFVARFGPLHPYRPWKSDAPPGPWPTPPSPAATIVHYGLAYPLNVGTSRRPVRVVLIPRDLRDSLAGYLDLPDVRSVSTISIPAPYCAGYDLDSDVFVFLSFLHRQDCAVHHGRWLAPRDLQALNEFLRPPDDLGAGRSELQAARIPFIHYLAERAGLAGCIGGYLKPTLIAQEWLAAPRSRRLCVLWDAWRERCGDNVALWGRYRLPALPEDDDPLARFHTLLEPLATCPAGPLGCLGDLLDGLVDRNPALLRPQATYATWAALDPDERTGFEARAREVLLALLTGPLAWFGVVDCRRMETAATGGTGGPADGRVPGPSTDVCMTPQGAVLLGRDDGAWPVDPDPAPLHAVCLVDRDEGDSGPTVFLDAPAGVPLPNRFALEAIVPPDPATPGRYCLTRSRFFRALQRGHTVEGVVNFLERASGEPLPAPVLGALYRWEEAFDRVAIRQVLLLQARDPAVLRDLAAQRRIRETLGATLNARTVEVRADRLDALLRRLARRDVLPRLDLPRALLGLPPDRAPDDEASCAAGWERGPGGEGQAERAVIAVALRVYAHLADALGLSTRPAYALARRWSQGLPLPLRDAVERTVAQTVEALHRAAPEEMEDRLPEPVGPLLESLERAIQERATVEIEYYTAGRAHRTTRRVDPLRLEWHGDVVYLVAHCHLRGEQRVFRVDRIGRVRRREERGGNGEWRIENRE